MTTATRQTKTETITRTITLAGAASGQLVASVAEVHHRKGEPKVVCSTYFLRPIPSQIGGTGIKVEKLGETEVRHVLLDGPSGHTCSCPWGEYRGHEKPCRHIEMCLEAHSEGKL